MINKVIKAQGDTQLTVTEGKEPTVAITADSQEYDTKTNTMKADGEVIIHYKELETYSNRAVIKTDKTESLKESI